MGRRGGRGRRGGGKNPAYVQDQAPSKAQAEEPVVAPTREQMDRVHYRRGVHTDEMGARVGSGYRREPLFETIARTKGNAITQDELTALRFYRSAFDRCERSPTKSCLNVGPGGGLHDPAASIVNTTPAIAEAKRKVQLCEAALGNALHTMRAVALHDLTFSEIAIHRYGGRRQNWIEVNEPVLRDGKPVKVNGKPLTRAVHHEKVAPRSGRHRDLIRREFIAGLRLLAKRVRALVSLPGVEEVWIEPGKTSAAIVRGACAPNGLYRLWGDSDGVDDLMSQLRDAHGEELVFPNAEAARAALDAADGGKLARLNDQELAA